MRPAYAVDAHLDQQEVDALPEGLLLRWAVTKRGWIAWGLGREQRATKQGGAGCGIEATTSGYRLAEQIADCARAEGMSPHEVLKELQTEARVVAACRSAVKPAQPPQPAIFIGTVIVDALGVKWVVYAFDGDEPLLIGRIGRHDPALGGSPPGQADFHAGPTSGPKQLDEALAKVRGTAHG